MFVHTWCVSNIRDSQTFTPPPSYLYPHPQPPPHPPTGESPTGSLQPTRAVTGDLLGRAAQPTGLRSSSPNTLSRSEFTQSSVGAVASVLVSLAWEIRCISRGRWTTKMLSVAPPPQTLQYQPPPPPTPRSRIWTFRIPNSLFF